MQMNTDVKESVNRTNRCFNYDVRWKYLTAYTLVLTFCCPISPIHNLPVVRKLFVYIFSKVSDVMLALETRRQMSPSLNAKLISNLAMSKC